MADYNVIVVGAGIGGLTVAARLVQEGLTVLVLEKNSLPGGRCYSRNINGDEFDIGALYIGERANEILKTQFKINYNVIPYKIGIKDKDDFISFPLTRKTIFELRDAGAGWFNIFEFFFNLRKLFFKKYFTPDLNAGDLWDSLSEIQILKKMGLILISASGVSPYSLPAFYLKINEDSTGTNPGNPIHFQEGNKTVADSLSYFFLNRGGEICFNEKAVSVKNKKNYCIVKSQKNEFTCDFVISDIGIKNMVLSLASRCEWPSEYVSAVKRIKMPLMLVCVFITFDSDIDLIEGYGVYFSSGNSIKEEFRSLENGELPEKPTFGIQIPTNIDMKINDHHRATLQFYYPKADVPVSAVYEYVDRIIKNRLDDIAPGLYRKIKNYEVYYPERYHEEFGMWPFVFLASPELGNKRFSVETPLKGIFCVGDSVLPHRPCVPQVMESGLLCANRILSKM